MPLTSQDTPEHVVPDNPKQTEQKDGKNLPPKTEQPNKPK